MQASIVKCHAQLTSTALISTLIRTRIRLRNIVAPEKGEPGYEEAKAALELRILGKKIKLKAFAIDAYGRTVGELTTEN